MIEKKDDFIREILNISQSVIEKGKVDYNVEKFKESFFRGSSHSPDNLESMNYIEYGAVRIKYLENRRVFGLKVKDKDVLLSDIIYFLESEEICKMIQNKFPELTVKEIEAVQRVFTVIMSDLECLELDD